MRIPVLISFLILSFIPLIAWSPFSAGYPDNLMAQEGQAGQRGLDESGMGVADDAPAKWPEPILQFVPASRPSSMPDGDAGADLPEPDPLAFMLAAIHFQSSLLDDELTLKRVLLAQYPEAQPVVDDESQWREQKDALKSLVLAEAKTAPLSFELQPWRASSLTKGRPVELAGYDADRQAFRVRFAVGNARQLVTRMLIPDGGEPAPKYLPVIDWFPVAPERAAQINSYFGPRQRKVYLNYRLRAVEAGTSIFRPAPVLVFENDQFILYALESKPQNNELHAGYRYLATVRVPTADTGTIAPAVPATVEDSPAGPDGIIQNVEVDGVKLGMPIEQALKQLAAHGISMGPPSRPSQLTGVTFHGHGTTADRAGWIKVMLREMDGIVYQYDKNAMSLLDSLPAGISVSDLKKKYHDEFAGMVAGARYTSTAANGTMHFDDTSPPPYDRNITSPHARITLVDSIGAGRFQAGFSIEWKQSVGAGW